MTELNNACKIIIKIIKNSAFEPEIQALKYNKPLSNSSKLFPLNFFLDYDKIVRVGRLRHQQSFTFEGKHPMLLPKTHPVSAATIRYFHAYSLHGGPDLALNLIRTKFWIPGRRSTMKKEILNCVTCRRVSAKPLSQIMGNSPPSRVNPCRAFKRVGVA